MQPNHDEIREELDRRLDWRGRLDEEVNRVTTSSIHLKQVPRIRCADGFSMSVQAGEFLYCTPRQSKVEWTEVEVGFPSERVEKLMPYVEDASKPTETVYAYVPIETVVDVIAEHGGFAAVARKGD